MPKSPFRRGGGDEEPPAMPPVTPESLSAFIDQGSEFEGKLSFKDTVRIDGHFKGEISSQNTLIVGEPGSVEASIRSKNVIVSGEVVGDIEAAERLVLYKSARVEGDITTPRLVIEEGALVQGRIGMIAESERRAHLKAIEGGGKSAPPAADPEAGSGKK